MSSLKSFLLFCAGIDAEILKKCPSDENKYMGIGATVFFTGLLAFFSGGYAMYTVFDNSIIAIAFGVVWGLMIFNLDRYIVSSMRSRGSFFRDFFMVLPRLTLALLLALVISKPLELKIFQKEIDAELVVMAQEVFKTQEDQVRLRYQQQIDELKGQVTLLREEIDEKTTRRDELALAALQEADGTGGSKIRNMGPIYKAKQQKADHAQEELEMTLAANSPLIAAKETNIEALESSIQTQIAAFDRSNYGGLAARMEAMSRLSRQSETILLANLFILLLFIAIETAPVLVKLISQKGPYDHLLHEHEHQFEMANLERTTLLANAVKNKLAIDTQTGVYKANAKVEVEKAMVDAYIKQKIESLNLQDISWKDDFLKA